MWNGASVVEQETEIGIIKEREDQIDHKFLGMCFKERGDA